MSYRGKLGLFVFLLHSLVAFARPAHPVPLVLGTEPQWSDTDIDFGIQNEGKAWSTALKDYITYTGTDAVVFTVANLPGWMKFDATSGTLSGTPARKDVPGYSNIQLMASAKGGTSTARAHGTVVKTIHAPQWTGTTIPLPDATEDFAYTQDITKYVLNYENTQITYAITSALAPAWIQVGTTSGQLYGTPGKTDVQPTTIAVQLHTDIDGVPYDNTATFTLNVIHHNHPPAWVAKIIPLPEAYTGLAYKQSLKNSVSDPDGDPLTFSISGPAWLKIDPQSGDISGQPSLTDVTASGAFASWTVTATDPGKLADTTQIQIRVIKPKSAPAWTNKAIVLGDAKEDASYSVDLSQYAKDPDGDAMKFTLIGGPKWITFTDQGTFQGIPRTTDVGAVKFKVKVEKQIDPTLGADVADVSFFVQPTNHAPFWKINPVVLNETEDKAVTEDISVFADDPDLADKGSLTFSAIAGPTPPWAQLSPKGVFSGTPGASAVGDTHYTVRVADKGGLTADVDVTFRVAHVNHPPYWTNSAITLTPNAKEGSNYQNSVAAFAKDPDSQDQGKLRFTALGTIPGWLTIGTDGSLSGTPARKDVATVSFQVQVMDPSNECATATVTLTVDKTTHAPKWRQNPVLLSDAFEGLNYRFDLTTYVKGEAGDTLNFSLVSGPRWLAVSVNGVVSGVPQGADVGKFQAVFQVADGNLVASANAVGNVNKRFQGPLISTTMPVFVVKERAVLQINLSDPLYVANPDGGTLQFGPAAPTPWIALAAMGSLTAKPTRSNLGDNAVPFNVSNDHGSVSGTLHIRVLKDPRPPQWSGPVALNARANEKYSDSVAKFATDLDGEALTFSKAAGKAWLTVGSDGSLGGTPATADLGDNAFTLSACNTDQACANAAIVIKVIPGAKVDIVHLDQPAAGARAEYLWVIDNSTVGDDTIRDLKKNIGMYYDGIKTVAHSGVYLSTDAIAFDGRPVHRQDQRQLILPTDGSLITNFNIRTDEAYSTGGCSNCDSSPIWSMYRFYDKAPKIADIYHNGYFTEGASMDVMIVTNQTDHHQLYQQKYPNVKSFTPYDYVRGFKDFHRFEKMPFRISVIAPMVAMIDQSQAKGSTKAYQTLVKETKGDYFPTDSGSFDMASTLKQYATKVNYRANAFARKTVKLAGVPTIPSSVAVRLGSTDLPGNTGSPNDQWSYNKDTNEITLNWNQIDPDLIQPGNDLQLMYRAD